MSLKTFVNGVAVGLILGVLFAPDRGDETRKKIAKKACDIKDSVTDKYNDIADTIADKYSNIKSKANEWMGKAEDAGEGAYDAAKNETTNMFE